MQRFRLTHPKAVDRFGGQVVTVTDEQAAVIVSNRWGTPEVPPKAKKIAEAAAEKAVAKRAAAKKTAKGR